MQCSDESERDGNPAAAEEASEGSVEGGALAEELRHCLRLLPPIVGIDWRSRWGAAARGESPPPPRIIFEQGEDHRMLRAAAIVAAAGLGRPVLLGSKALLEAEAAQLELSLEGLEVIDPLASPLYPAFVERLHRARRRRGTTRGTVARALRQRVYFGAMMVCEGAAEVFIARRSGPCRQAAQPLAQVMSHRLASRAISATHVAAKGSRRFLLADTGIQQLPTADQLVHIAENTHALALDLGLEPRIALLSLASSGAGYDAPGSRIRRAAEALWLAHPDWEVDGPLEADLAVAPGGLEADYPFCRLDGGANCLIFPSLDAASITHQLLRSIGGATVVGPVLGGLTAPLHLLPRDAEVPVIVQLAAIGAIQARRLERAPRPREEQGQAAALNHATALVRSGDESAAME